MRIKLDDMVEVIAGDDKGVRGKVLKVDHRSQKVIVEGVNRVKRHTRVAESQRGAKTGGIVTQEAPIHISNVMLVDADKKPTRVGYRFDSDGTGVVTAVASASLLEAAVRFAFDRGAEVVEAYPVSTLPPGVALNMTVSSYAGTMFFGLVGGRSALPDLQRLGVHLQGAFEDFRGLAGA